MRYSHYSGLWTRYCRDRHQRWKRYTRLAPATDIMRVLDEIDRDPTRIFWADRSARRRGLALSGEPAGRYCRVERGAYSRRAAATVTS